MIKNDWQLRVTQKRIKDFEDGLFELGRLPESETQPWLRAAQRESQESELNNLRLQVEEYELLKAGKVKLPGAEVIEQVPDLLIKTRISKGLKQEDLAQRLGVSKQCVQQYEQTNYAHVTLSTAQHVMHVLLNADAAPTKKRQASISQSSNASVKTVAKKVAGGKSSLARKRGKRA